VNASPARTLLSVLVAAATIVVILGVSVILFLNPVWVRFEQDRTGAAALTGYTPTEVHAVAGEILHDMVLGPPTFAQAVDGAAVFNDRERSHLVDVRRVFVAFGGLALVAAVALVSARIASQGASWFRQAVGSGAVVLACAVVLGAVVSLVAFDQAFEVFHELFFAGGSYTFDPATDRLVQLFPIQFWEETSLAVGAVILVVSGGVAWWGLGREAAR
jgi:integral membrane protein (TIGR01906 family)